MMVQRLSVHFGVNKLSSPPGGLRRHSFRPDLHAFKMMVFETWFKIYAIISNFQAASSNQCKLLDFFMISVTLLAGSHGILQAFEHLI